MSRWKTTVIIPCYKAAGTLPRAVQSALCDAPDDLQLLLVDDGSPDGTGALCDQLAAGDARITALHRPNGGAGAARNTGLAAAAGDWVLFLDADDELLPGLWQELDRLTPDDSLAMVLFHMERASGGNTVSALAPGRYNNLGALGDALSPLLFDTGLLAAPYPKLFRRSTIGTLRFDERLAINEDVLFNTLFLQKSSAIYCLYGVYYRVNDRTVGSLSRSLRGDLLDAERITRPALQALLEQNSIDPAPYLHTSRVRACLNQYGLLTGCRGTLPFARRRAVFAEILSDCDARDALLQQLQADPHRLLALPYRLGVRLCLPGWLAAYTMAKQWVL